MSKVKWDKVEKKAAKMFCQVADYVNSVHLDDEEAELIKGAGELLQGIAAIRAQRLAEEKHAEQKDEFSKKPGPRIKSASKP